MTDPRRPLTPALSRRGALILGASSVSIALASAFAGQAPAAYAAVSPRLPNEVGRQTNLVTRFAGTRFDHIRVLIGGDSARLFIPQGIVPGAANIPVLWLYHATQSSDDALTGGFRAMGERAVDTGLIVVCQNLGGTLYSSDRAIEHQVNGWNYLSSIYGIDRNFLRATSHGGALATEVLVRGLIPHVVGAYILNGVYDVERLYANGTPAQHEAIGLAFDHDPAKIASHNPARHAATSWSGLRVRLVYSQPDQSDPTVPPDQHAKALLTVAQPLAKEASVRTHANGHGTPSFADEDAQQTIVRWMKEISVSQPPTGPAPVASWEFVESTAPFASAIQGVTALEQGSRSTAKHVATPFGGGVEFNGTTDYLRIPRTALGPLNIGATTGAVTIAAWVLSNDSNNAMIAGCWQEASTGGERAYALFNDLPTYGGDDRVCMHVSRTGGATPGYSGSRDLAVDPRTITRGRWQFQVGTFDGAQAIAYLDGTAQGYPSFTDSAGATYAKNPYLYPSGINPAPIDFLVGAGLRNGAPLNLHKGVIARLRVWNEALSPEAILALYNDEKIALG